MAVDRPDVFEAEIGEHGLGCERIFDTGLETVQSGVRELPEKWQTQHCTAAFVEDPLAEHILRMGSGSAEPIRVTVSADGASLAFEQAKPTEPVPAS